MRRPLVGALALAVLLGACGSGDGVEDDSTLSADTLTAAQQRARKDSAVAGSGLPGAGAVGRAIDASEAARARNAAHDSLQ